MKDARAFYDTNVFVYFWDEREPSKRQQATKLVDAALTSRDNCISLQVVQEFFNAAFKKFPLLMPRLEADEFCFLIFSAFEFVTYDLTTVSKAIQLRERYQLAWYDSLIVAGALQAECTVLYSEDFQHGQVFEGKLTVVNPFTIHKN